MLYRLGLSLRLHPVQRIRARLGGDEFFREPSEPNDSLKPSGAWKDEALYFGWYKASLNGKPPSWLTNPFNGKTVEASGIPWWKLSDFQLDAGDIKTIWEASRFEWVPILAQRAKTGDKTSLERLNHWLADWCRVNPAYYGPNWKCGQEASIRVMHLAMAARILEQPVMLPDLANLIKAHLKRISPTTSYAVAQDNNHGTSEAAALFMGGNWCRINGIAGGERWEKKGRRLLENRVKRLVAPDGSFSQYSVNYHRVLIDTLSMAEIWRRWQVLDEFSPLFYRRAQASVNWLFTLVEPESGEAPNLGGNDGARLLPLSDAGYRDFRPSVQLAAALFEGRRAYDGEEMLDMPLKWLGIREPGQEMEQPGSRQFDSGGYAVLREGRCTAVLKYPRYRFRPRHCDLLHVDLWHGSDNLLRDGGSYSYNAEKNWQDYFTGPAAHNTIEFDSRDQMPRLGRFLRGAWPEAQEVEYGRDAGGMLYAAAGYQDWAGAFHHRRIELKADVLKVFDNVRGFRDQAVLRWRLQPGEWQIEGMRVSMGCCSLRIHADVPAARLELVEGWESRYYFHKSPLPVLEVEINQPGEIVTEIIVGS